MGTTVSPFWTRWLLVVSVMGTVLGVILFATPLIQQTVGGVYYDQYLGAGAYTTLSNPEVRFQQFVYGVMGAVMAAWMMALVFLIHVPFRRGEKWAWYAIDISTAMWFIGDTYISIVTGFGVHALVNLGLLVAIGIPLLMTFRHFHRPHNPRLVPAGAP